MLKATAEDAPRCPLFEVLREEQQLKLIRRNAEIQQQSRN
jgi:hypothetical protein